MQRHRGGGGGGVSQCGSRGRMQNALKCRRRARAVPHYAPSGERDQGLFLGKARKGVESLGAAFLQPNICISAPNESSDPYLCAAIEVLFEDPPV